MTFYESMGWVALALNVWGNIALAKKSIPGWLIRLACNVAFVIYSAAFSIWPLLINHIIFAGVNIYGWFEWTKNTYVCKCGRKYERSSNGSVCHCELPIVFKS